jgi:methionine transaminase
MLQVQSKLPQVGTTIFTVMSTLANQHQAINLGQGFPDFDMDTTLMNLVHTAMQKGFNQYTHMNGYLPLREILAQKSHQLYQANLNPETDITITPGGTYAIYTALTTVLQPGDEVIVFEPAYDSYIPNIETNGAIPITISLQYPHYNIPWQEVKEKITFRTRMIMINSPHNPTGAVLKPADIEALQKITAGTQILILSDEVYEHLIFDEIPHLSILRYPDLMERSFVCFSFGKTYHCTGWKLGYCISNPSLMAEFRKVHQFNGFSCDTPKQVALATYLQNSSAYLELGAQIQAKRDYFRTLMAATPFTPIPSHGSYFECYSYQGLSHMTDKDFAIWLTQQFGVASIPVSAFYKTGTDHQVIRFCFAKKENTLEAAVERLSKWRP